MIREWLTGWIETLRIRFWTPGVYRQLADGTWRNDASLSEFTEVDPPGELSWQAHISQADPEGIYSPDTGKGHHETDTDNQETTPGS